MHMHAPIPLYQALEEEYAQVHAVPYTPAGWEFTADQILDSSGVYRAITLVARDARIREHFDSCLAIKPILRQSFDAKNKLAVALTALLTDTKLVERIIAACGAHLDRQMGRWQKLGVDGAESQFNRLRLESWLGSSVRRIDDLRLKNLYAAIHAHTPPQAALCLSGGGIRSATFSLGVIQSLAKQNLLNDFHYLSTVSGGGYIGSWFSGWIRRHRHGTQGVSELLAGEPAGPLKPAPPQIDHLRAHSNYLVPQMGLFSGDTWALVGSYARNLTANLFIIVPLLLAALLVPKIAQALITSVDTSGVLFDALTLLGLGAMAIGMMVLTTHRPSLRRRPDVMVGSGKDSGQGFFFLASMLPLLLGCALLCVNWYAEKPGLRRFVMAGLFVQAGALYHLWISRHRLWGSIKRLGSDEWKSWRDESKELHAVLEVILLFGAGIAGGSILYYLSPLVRGNGEVDAVRFTMLAPSLFLFTFLAAATLYVMFVTRTGGATDEDLEWWARSGGFTLLAAAVWTALSGIVFYAPRLFDDWRRFGLFVLSLFVVAVIIRLARGSVQWTVTLAALFVVTSAAALTELVMLAPIRGWFINARFFANAEQLALADKLVSVACFAALALFGVFNALLIDINKFSMHSMYRNRLMRAYLGASRSYRRPNPFTGFDPEDNLDLDELTPEAFDESAFPDLPSLIIQAAAESDSSQPATALYTLVRELKAVDSRSAQLLRSIRDQQGRLLSLEKKLANAERLSAAAGERNARHEKRVQRLLRMIAAQRESIRVHASESQRWFVRGLNLLLREPLLGTRLNAPQPAGQSAPAMFMANRRLLDDLLGAHVVPFDLLEITEESVLDWETLESGLSSQSPAALRIQEKLRSDLELALPVNLVHDRAKLIRAFNKDVLPANFPPTMYEEFSDTVQRLSRSQPVGDDRRILNRLMLEETFPGAFRHWRSRRPFHVVNTALNMVQGEELAWQERMAESFWMSPLHCGSKRLGLRRSHEYGGRISLATAITISGAAASPNMGYHSSPALSFLLTLLNVRLGWWLGNPGIWGAGEKGKQTFHRASPRLAIKPIVCEALGLTNEERSYVYLSDGGHFENLGLYEMVRRRCRYIVVCDAGQDSQHAFQDLGNAIRKIRVDLGVPIEIKERHIYPKNHPRKDVGKYCAVGTIQYSHVDGEEVADGKLLYLKPAFYGKEPVDVYNYGVDHIDFPHEPTANQFFGESQFESYRMLGQHIIETIGNTTPPAQKDAAPSSPLALFLRRAEAYLASDAATRVREDGTPPGGAPPPPEVVLGPEPPRDVS
jgi:hypothetical protein